LSWLARIFSQLNRPSKPEADPYRAFVIGPDGLAVAVHFIAAEYDGLALERATQLQSKLRIELWCGARKVADIPATDVALG
jgi:hypothetical protein